MNIFCHSPSHGFSRLYICANSLEEAIATNKDDVWEQIKKHKFSMEPGEEKFYWDDDEEQEERDKWFADWHNLKDWSKEGPIAIDTMY